MICWDLDRLYRNRKKLIEFFELCKMYNCQIHSYRQDWLEQLYKIPEPFNEIMHTLMLNLMGWLGEDESKKRSDRISRAVRKKDGITKSYKGNKWGRRRKPINEEYILELYKQGYSTYQIAKMYSDNPKFKSNISHQTAFNIIKKSSSNITKQK